MDYADAHDNCCGFRVATEVDELVEGDGVDVFWFVERDQKVEGIFGEFMNFLKTTMNIHKRKIKNFGKENGELLTEY